VFEILHEVSKSVIWLVPSGLYNEIRAFTLSFPKFCCPKVFRISWAYPPSNPFCKIRSDAATAPMSQIADPFESPSAGLANRAGGRWGQTRQRWFDQSMD
jgi:hypothetical protein